MSRAAWLSVAERVLTGETTDLRCPENDDDYLEVKWIPSSSGGEYRLRCPTCQATNFVRVGPVA